MNITELKDSIKYKCKEDSAEEVLCDFYWESIDEILSMNIAYNEKEIDWVEKM